MDQAADCSNLYDDGQRQREQQARYQQQQANAARQNGSQNFNRAYAACMTGRNYQVQ